jgi:uncharacterized protein (TIGR03435 family)
LPASGEIRLTAASGSGQPHCGKAATTTIPGLNSVRCTNVTLPDLALYLPDLVPLYIDRPVIDSARVGGAFDVTLTYVTARPQPLLSADTPLGTDPGASPTGPTIFQALRNEAGLSLESRRQPVPVRYPSSIR